MSKFLFVTIAGKIGSVDVGVGHLNRSIVIAKEVIERGHSVYFLYSGDKKAEKILNESKLEYYQIDLDNLSNSTNKFEALNKECEISFIDLSHPFILDNFEKINFLINMLNKNGNKLILIDSSDQIILKKVKKESIDLLIVADFAFIGLNYDIKQKLVGEEFVILSKEYRDVPKKKIVNRARNFLVSCGGSDPGKLTLLSLAALSKIEGDLNIKIVIGPLFSKELRDSIEKVALVFPHKIEIISSPNSLFNYIVWSDIVISASGLTKYEIMATGTPSVLILYDDKQLLINQYLINSKATHAVHRDIPENQFTNDLISLMQNRLRRKEMSKISQSIIDTKGVDRIINFIEKEYISSSLR
jgi:spore coat polysaccharide biosynthesis predicted glycosyltransferase SpsG